MALLRTHVRAALAVLAVLGLLWLTACSNIDDQSPVLKDNDRVAVDTSGEPANGGLVTKPDGGIHPINLEDVCDSQYGENASAVTLDSESIDGLACHAPSVDAGVKGYAMDLDDWCGQKHSNTKAVATRNNDPTSWGCANR
jgi:hypothetical protein